MCLHEDYVDCWPAPELHYGVAYKGAEWADMNSYYGVLG